MNCLCNNNLTKLREDVNLEEQDTISYPEGINTVGQLWKDVTYPINNNFIRGVMWGAKWNNLPNNELTWTINYGNSGKTSVDVWGQSSNNVNLIIPTIAVRNAVQTCMDDLAKIINLNIRKVTDISEAILSFNFLDNSGGLGFLGVAIPPVPTNDPYYNIDKNYTSLVDSFFCSGNIYIGYNSSMNFEKGSYNYITLVHELGHAIGFAHPHDNGGNSEIFTGVSSAFGDFGTYNANLQPLTIMTYNDTQSPYVPNTSSSLGFLATFGPIDIVALQFMYGANPISINTTYTFPSTGINNFWETIWDNGGIDEIDASSSNVDITINLNDATIVNNTQLAGVSLSNNLFGGFTIANGTIIENVTTGIGNDNIIGNEVNNQITITQGGQDNIDGGLGFDTVIINNVINNFSINYNPISGTYDIDDGSNLVKLKNCEKIIFTDTSLNLTNTFFDVSFNDILEYGRININHRWFKVNLNKTFIRPVIIASEPTFRGKQSAGVRIRNIQSNSFQIRLQEPRYLDGRHTNETITYIVGEAGNWKINDDLCIKIGSINTNKLSSRGFVNVFFDASFNEIPNVLTSTQTYNGGDWVITRTRNISKTAFQVCMQEVERKNRGRHVTEKIGFMGISKGNFEIDGIKIESNNLDGFTHRNKRINYVTNYNNTPFLITKLSSYRGRDTANTRVVANNKDYFIVKIHEEQSKDRETRHISETVSFLSLL